MHLAFHYHIPAIFKNGKIYTISYQGLFIDSLAALCSHVTLLLYQPLRKELEEMNYEIVSSNVTLISLTKHYKIPFRILLYPFMKKRFQESTGAGKADILLMRAPTPLLPLITRTIRHKIPYAFLVVGEMSLHVDDIKQKEWRKSLIRRYVSWNESFQEKYASDALVFANSAVTYEKYRQLTPDCHEIRTTTLSNRDFFIRKDTCLSDTIEILYAGRIEQDKGVLDIAQAVGILNREGTRCRLNLVGWTVQGDQTMNLLTELARSYEIEDKIIFHGFKKAGPELFKCYRESDIFIVASQNNEGFPRTIWEALANSVPVLATSVGSISSFLKNEYDALFIRTRNPGDICEKVKMLVVQPELRQKLIANGLETVKEVTLEIQSGKMVDEMKNYLATRKK